MLKNRRMDTISHLFKKFSLQIIIIFTVGFLIESSIALFLEYHTIKRNDQDNLAKLSNDIREDILRRQDITIIEKCLNYFKSERILSIRIRANDSVICSNSKESSFLSSSFVESVYFDSEKQKQAGDISVQYSYDIFLLTGINILLVYVLIIASVLLLIQRLLKKINNKIINPIQLLANQFVTSESKMPSISVNYFEVIEIQHLQSSYLKMTERIEDFRKKEIEQIQLGAFSEIAKQVSHDIRSPLSALNMIMPTLKDVAEEKRLVIRNAVNRINDIANQLLDKSKQFESTSKSIVRFENNVIQQGTQLSVHLLSPLIDNIISEKRTQFREMQNVDIEVDLSHGYGLFAKINSIEFNRVLSNLINNSVEAFSNKKGKIKVSIQSNNDFVFVEISDNGKGMPSSVLNRIGERGVTYGKSNSQSGSGLGLYHAKKIVEEFGGTLTIKSQLENQSLLLKSGTVITLTFIKEKAPKWFVEKLFFYQNMKVISVDDDLSIHQIWRARLESKKNIENQIEHISFTSGFEFKNWYKSIKRSENSPVYLIDFELLNQSQTGLEIIEELNLKSNAILVTSRYEELSIREKCEKLGVKLIPKVMAGFVPIEIYKPKMLFDAILIDDDELVHLTWKMAAQNQQKNILCFYSPDEFLIKISDFNLNTPIYVDSNLGASIKGEEISKKISEMGFVNIYLCTGYHASEFIHLPWIKEIVGKEPNF